MELILLIALVVIFSLGIHYGIRWKDNFRETFFWRENIYYRFLFFISGFKVTFKVVGVEEPYLFAVDHQQKKIIVISGKDKSVFCYSDLIGAEIVEDGKVRLSKFYEQPLEGEVAKYNFFYDCPGCALRPPFSDLYLRLILEKKEKPQIDILCYNAEKVKRRHKNDPRYKECTDYKHCREQVIEIFDLVTGIADDRNWKPSVPQLT